MKNKLCSSLLCEYGQCPGSPTCVILTYYVRSSGQGTSSSQRIYLKQNKLLLFLKLFKWKTMFDNVLALTHKCRYAHTRTHTLLHTGMRAQAHTQVQMGRSEDSLWELNLSSHHVGTGGQTWAIKFGSKSPVY